MGAGNVKHEGYLALDVTFHISDSSEKTQDCQRIERIELILVTAQPSKNWTRINTDSTDIHRYILRNPRESVQFVGIRVPFPVLWAAA